MHNRMKLARSNGFYVNRLAGEIESYTKSEQYYQVVLNIEAYNPYGKR